MWLWVHSDPKLQLCLVHSNVGLFILNFATALWDCTSLYALSTAISPVDLTIHSFSICRGTFQFSILLFNLNVRQLKVNFICYFHTNFHCCVGHISLRGLSEFSDTLRLPLNWSSPSSHPADVNTSKQIWNYLLMASGHCIFWPCFTKK